MKQYQLIIIKLKTYNKNIHAFHIFSTSLLRRRIKYDLKDGLIAFQLCSISIHQYFAPQALEVSFKALYRVI